MTKRDLIIGLVAGFVIGLFAIPTAKNIELFQKIPSPYLLLLVVLPLAAALGVWVAGFIGRRWPVIWQVAKFGLIGVMNTAIDLGIYNILIFATGYDKGTPLAFINTASFGLAIVNSYFWNKRWVFGGVKTRNRQEFLQFLAVSLASIIISGLLVKFITDYISPVAGLSAVQWADVAKGAAIIASFLVNFFGYKFIVFRPRI